MFGLFLYTYDYHEWEEFQCCSSHIGMLKTEWSTIATGYPLIEENGHEHYAGNEEPHFMIKEIREIA